MLTLDNNNLSKQQNNIKLQNTQKHIIEFVENEKKCDALNVDLTKFKRRRSGLVC